MFFSRQVSHFASIQLSMSLNWVMTSKEAHPRIKAESWHINLRVSVSFQIQFFWCAAPKPCQWLWGGALTGCHCRPTSSPPVKTKSIPGFTCTCGNLVIGYVPSAGLIEVKLSTWTCEASSCCSPVSSVYSWGVPQQKAINKETLQQLLSERLNLQTLFYRKEGKTLPLQKCNRTQSHK